MHTSEIIHKGTMARWYGMAVGIGLLIALVVSIPAIHPLWVLLGLVASVVIVKGILRFPAIMLVPVIYFPELKDLSIFRSIQSRIDLTLLSLIILSVAVAINLVSVLAKGGTVKELFAGQWKGIIAFFAFAGVVALSYTYTSAPEWGFTVASRLWGIGGLLFLAPFVLIKREKDFRQFAISFVLLGVALAASMIFMPHYMATQGGWVYGIQTDIGGGWVVGMAILVLFYYPLGKSNSSKWLWRLFCGPALIAGLIAATSRGPIVSLLLVFMVTPLVLPRKKGASSKALTSLGILLAMVVIGVAAASLSHKVENKYQEKLTEIDRVLHGEWPGGSMGQRLDFYQAALGEIPERPVLGLGIGGWSMYYYGHDIKSYPHNLILSVAVEEGLLGLIALTAFLYVVGLTLKRILALTGDRYVILFALVVFCFSVGMFSGSLDSNRLLWFWSGMTFTFARMMRLGPGIPQPLRAWGRSGKLSYAFPNSDADQTLSD